MREPLDEAGIRIDGDAPWDMRVFDDEAYRRILGQGSLGLGEAYMDGLWEADRLDEFFHRLLRCDLNEKFSGLERCVCSAPFLHHWLLNPQSSLRAFRWANSITISVTMFSRPCSIPPQLLLRLLGERRSSG